MPGLFQLCKGSWESFSLTFQKCNLPRAGGHQRWSGDNQTPPNPNPGSLPSTKNKNKIKKTKPNKWMRKKHTIFVNKHVNICVESITAPNNRFLQFPTPREEIFRHWQLNKDQMFPSHTLKKGDVIKTTNFAPGDKFLSPFTFAVQHSWPYSATAKVDKGSFKCLLPPASGTAQSLSGRSLGAVV